ncbi:aspartate kinase [Cryptococcus deuterogattii LA55]|nr:aspartate kinase [Cryptococcus deuterogattii LA55]KIR34184.1 aspartate kinase [Cryptococcus deuterogattii MMRL2647]KIR91256.1 aspartate kinase [Cryptococcus deuterogattii CBS 10090]KIR98556.1 aspartate kinase [Cryptococcus deuterogattii 2001/935-1]
MSSASTPTAPYLEDLIRNSLDQDIPWVVQKYGGTSVGKSLDNITKIVGSYIDNGSKVAIVCSARSTQTKSLGTTNLLLQASREALQPAMSSSGDGQSGSVSGTATPFYPKRVGSGFFGKDQPASMTSSVSSLSQLDSQLGRSGSPSPFQSSCSRSPPRSPVTPSQDPSVSQESAFHTTVDLIKKGHLQAARASLKEGPLREELEEEIERDCESLRSFLYAAQIIDEISPRSQDSIVGTGERLACKIVAAALRDRGVDSELVVLDNIVDASMAAASEAVSIDSGDQGVAQLGQEFYDQLSIRLGERLRECGQRVPVVTGYFGPVPGSLLAQIGRGYTDLCAALCAVGLKASELQVWKEVDGIFTADPRKVPSARLVPMITPDEAAELTYYGSEVIHPFTMEQVIRARIPIRIKNVENPSGAGTVIYPDVGFPRGLDTEPPKAERVVEDRAGVVVDLISTSEVHVSMAMQDFLNRKRLERLVKDLEKIGDVTVSKDMAILSLVGRNMRNAIGSAGLMFASLARAMINIEMISQGASEINISCVIENKDAIKALNVIHESCLSYPRSPTTAMAGLKLQ